VRAIRIWLLLIVGLALAAPLCGQQPSSAQPAAQETAQAAGESASPSAPEPAAPPASTGAQPTQGVATQPGKPAPSQESRERIFKVVPNFSVAESNAQFTPLTVHEKWRLYYRQTIDPFHFVSIGFSAGIGQARDQFHDYGQGMEGYGKRYGAGFADSSLGGFFGSFLLPSLMHDDPRYFRRGSGSMLHRGLYAASRVFVIRHDDGSPRPNYPGLLGAFIGTGFGNLYYPKSERGPGTTFVRGAYVIEGGAIGFVFQEFWPDIHDKIFKKKKRRPED
jgi:hypothetical protein